MFMFCSLIRSRFVLVGLTTPSAAGPGSMGSGPGLHGGSGTADRPRLEFLNFRPPYPLLAKVNLRDSTTLTGSHHKYLTEAVTA